MAVEEMKQFRLGPLFTPPSLRGTLMRPRESGGANWGGAAFAPETGFLFVRSSEGVSPNQVCKTDPFPSPTSTSSTRTTVPGERPPRSSGASRAESSRGDPVDQAAVRQPRGHRSQPGRDRVESAIWRGQRAHSGPSPAAGCGTTRTPGHVRQQRTDGDRQWARLHRRRRALPVRDRRCHWS